ncbi:hypothetical protein CQ14_13355 [Bradyrhizobium lablabi]|uniref:Uncharacterized protein n=2 Tax=Bradyrhizobium lablabi TaxID=722472 RepID=A0A0R3MAQ6_9BRAD|nr:hypothetical protein CQ14_13355 [Bradyrhizobium lablabi]
MCGAHDVVMAGLVPAIHVFGTAERKQDVDARDICAKTRFALLPGHDSGECGVSMPKDRILPWR